MASFDTFKVFIANPPHSFKMPFLIITEVLKGENNYFAEYFAGIRGSPDQYFSIKLTMDFKNVPTDLVELPGFLSDQAMIMGMDSIQGYLDDLASKSGSQVFSRVVMVEVPKEKHYSTCRFFMNTEAIKRTIQQTQSIELQNFLGILLKLPEISMEKR